MGEAWDGELAVPEDCVAWCREQDYGVSVCDDMAPVDLDWWNRRLERHAIPTRIVGRDADGAPTDHGIGYLRRADLTVDLHADTVTGHGSPELGVLYRAAAWLSGHPHRDRRRTFPDVGTAARPGHDVDAITTALAACRHAPWQAIPDAAPRRRWSGWPQTPGVGPTVTANSPWVSMSRPPRSMMTRHDQPAISGDEPGAHDGTRNTAEPPVNTPSAQGRSTLVTPTHSSASRSPPALVPTSPLIHSASPAAAIAESARPAQW